MIRGKTNNEFRGTQNERIINELSESEKSSENENNNVTTYVIRTAEFFCTGV